MIKTGDYIVITNKLTPYEDLTICKPYKVGYVCKSNRYFNILDDTGDKVTVYTEDDPDFIYYVITTDIAKTILKGDTGPMGVSGFQRIIEKSIKMLEIEDKNITKFDFFRIFITVNSLLDDNITLTKQHLSDVLENDLHYNVFNKPKK